MIGVDTNIVLRYLQVNVLAGTEQHGNKRDSTDFKW